MTFTFSSLPTSVSQFLVISHILQHTPPSCPHDALALYICRIQASNKTPRSSRYTNPTKNLNTPNKRKTHKQKRCLLRWPCKCHQHGANRPGSGAPATRTRECESVFPVVPLCVEVLFLTFCAYFDLKAPGCVFFVVHLFPDVAWCCLEDFPDDRLPDFLECGGPDGDEWLLAEEDRGDVGVCPQAAPEFGQATHMVPVPWQSGCGLVSCQSWAAGQRVDWAKMTTEWAPTRHLFSYKTGFHCKSMEMDGTSRHIHRRSPHYLAVWAHKTQSYNTDRASWRYRGK